MKRRSFLQTTALGGAGLTIAGACQSGNEDGSASGKGTAPKDWNDFELLEASASDLRQQMDSGQRTALQITRAYLARIKAIDQDGPSINSVIELNPEAEAIAKKLDEERANGQVRGPLHGIPVLIKDNIDTGDQMMTTAGSLALEGHRAAKDAFIIDRLREAGMVLLGKANLSEWANFRSTRSSSGWSSRGGQTLNPYILDRNPCGSSSGSGASVSANLCAIAIGTETNGSIVCPSSHNGLVGLKPTVGLWSRQGIIPISASQDTAGPMARTVRDAALLLGTLTGEDPADPATAAAKGNIQPDYTTFLTADGLQGARIGIYREVMGFHEEVDKVMEAAFALIKSKGAELIDLEQVPEGGIGQEAFLVLQYEFKDGLNKYLAGLPDGLPKSLEEVIAFNEANAGRCMPWFQQEVLVMSQEKGGLDSAEYQNALKDMHAATRKNGIDKVMDENKLDAIVGPTNGPAWPIDLVNGDHYGGGSSSPAARAGYPNITVPAGFVHGLPIGISIFGRAWSEPTLLKIAYAYEQASQHRSAPEFKPSLIS